MGKQPEVLKDHANGTSYRFEVYSAIGLQPMVAYGDGPCIKGIETIDTAEEGRFPSSRRAEQTNRLPFFHMKRNVIEDGFAIVAFR